MDKTRVVVSREEERMGIKKDPHQFNLHLYHPAVTIV